MVDDQDYDALFKIVLVGDSSVGKSNLLLRLMKKEFNQNSKATVGVEFGMHVLKIENAIIKAQIWDTAGQERYRAITSAYYKGAQGAIIVYDITSTASFNSVDRWVTDLKNNGDERMCVLLVGNKNDLEDERKVSKAMAEEKAKHYQLAFIETSAKNSCNVEKAFEMIIKDMYNNYKEDEAEDEQNIHIGEKAGGYEDVLKSEKKSCCKK